MTTELPHSDLDDVFLGFRRDPLVVEDGFQVSVRNLNCRRGREVGTLWREPLDSRAAKRFWESVVKNGSFEFVGEPCTSRSSKSGLLRSVRLHKIVSGGQSMSAIDVNVHLPLLAECISPSAFQRVWSVPSIFNDSVCVRTGKALGAHISITESMSDLVAAGSGSQTFRFQACPEGLFIARAKNREVLCIKGVHTSSKTDVCMVIGTKKFS